MGIEVDVAVVGAGIGGVSVAAGLAAQRSVVVLEQEDRAAYHTTGRSAAMFLESYGSPAVRGLTTASRALFDRLGLLAPRPELIVAAGADQEALEGMHLEQPELVRLSAAEAVALCPAVRADRIAGGLLEPGAQDIDVAGLHQHYLRTARQHGARTMLSARVLAGRHDGKRWLLETAAGRVAARVVVNAAGAWADRVAGALGVPVIGLRPLRRTAVVARSSGVDPRWPLVTDVRETFYFRPEGAGVLVSPADETPSEPCDARPDDLDVALALERVNDATTLGLRSVVAAWAGLRTFSPDRDPVGGPDPAAPDLFWLAGQGGYGIQMGPALADVVTAAVDGAPVPAAVSPARFGGRGSGRGSHERPLAIGRSSLTARRSMP